MQGMTDEGLSVEQFRRRCVEPMGEESDHVHIVALTDALQVGLFALSEMANHHSCPRSVKWLSQMSPIRPQFLELYFSETMFHQVLQGLCVQHA